MPEHEHLEPQATLHPVASRLRSAVHDLHLSQAALARSIGTTSSFVSDVLRGTKLPGIRMLTGLVEVHRVSIDWLLSGQGSMFRYQPEDVDRLQLAMRDIEVTSRLAKEATSGDFEKCLWAEVHKVAARSIEPFA
jgi:transcriptional regulator with XRE-family HTH domain